MEADCFDEIAPIHLIYCLDDLFPTWELDIGIKFCVFKTRMSIVVGLKLE